MTGKYILRFPLCDRKLKIQCESQDRTIYQRAVFHARTTRCHNIVTLSPVQIDGGLTSQLRSASPPTPLRMARGVVCEVTPIGLLTQCVGIFISRCGVLSLTDLTDLTDPFCALFRTHRTPPAYRIHRTLQLKKGVGCWVLGVDDQLRRHRGGSTFLSRRKQRSRGNLGDHSPLHSERGRGVRL